MAPLAFIPHVWRTIAAGTKLLPKAALSVAAAGGSPSWLIGSAVGKAGAKAMTARGFSPKIAGGAQTAANLIVPFALSAPENAFFDLLSSGKRTQVGLENKHYGQLHEQIYGINRQNPQQNGH